jgi:hypothetical protein
VKSGKPVTNCGALDWAAAGTAAGAALAAAAAVSFCWAHAANGVVNISKANKGKRALEIIEIRTSKTW